MVKIALRVTMPDELMQPFMEMINGFNDRYDPDKKSRVHIELLADSQFPADKLEAMFRAAFPSAPFVATKRFDS